MDNNNGKGIFYGVIGVATLVVAIIGATFAYFSATVTPDSNSDAISGTTNGTFASTLQLSVTKELTQTVGSNDLVPTDIPSSDNGSAIINAINANCEADGYTGCHLYKITARADQTVSHANINLVSLTTTNNTDKSSWHYQVFQADDSGSGSSVYSDYSAVSVSGASGTFDRTTPVDIHGNASLTANTPVDYYLLIWIENDTNRSQNAADEYDVTGSYSGTVEMQAAGGKVAAVFAD